MRTGEPTWQVLRTLLLQVGKEVFRETSEKPPKLGKET